MLDKLIGILIFQFLVTINVGYMILEETSNDFSNLIDQLFYSFENPQKFNFQGTPEIPQTSITFK